MMTTMRSLLTFIAVSATTFLPINTLALSTARIKSHPSSSVWQDSFNPSSRSLSVPPSPLLSSVAPPRILLESTIEEKTLERGTTTLTNENENNNLSPFLQSMVNEQRELQMNVGKAMDTLRKDYPDFLKRAPDYSIYHDDISLKASDDQIQLSQLSSYKKAFGFTRTMLSLLYDTDKSIIQSRMVYDSTRTQIRVSFNARLVPKIIRGARTVHVDGISVYSLDLSCTTRKDAETGKLIKIKNNGAGKILEHRIDKLLVNGNPLQPPYFNAFGLELMTGSNGGALVGAGAWS